MRHFEKSKALNTLLKVYKENNYYKNTKAIDLLLGNTYVKTEAPSY